MSLGKTIPKTVEGEWEWLDWGGCRKVQYGDDDAWKTFIIEYC